MKDMRLDTRLGLRKRTMNNTCIPLDITRDMPDASLFFFFYSVIPGVTRYCIYRSWRFLCFEVSDHVG